MSDKNKPFFGMPIISRDGAEVHPDLKGRVFYLVGWDDVAFAFAKIKGSTDIDFCTGKVMETFRLATDDEIASNSEK